MRKLVVRGCLLVFILILSTLLLAGCSGKNPQSPSEVVKGVLKKANNGEYEETERYFTEEGLEGITYSGSTELAWVAITKTRTIDQTNILNEQIDGDTSKVKYELSFEGGETVAKTCKLTKVDGKWKISVF